MVETMISLGLTGITALYKLLKKEEHLPLEYEDLKSSVFSAYLSSNRMKKLLVELQRFRNRKAILGLLYTIFEMKLKKGRAVDQEELAIMIRSIPKDLRRVCDLG
jgi:hypothetical protein